MTRILVYPKNINHIVSLNNSSISGYIIGIKNFSIFQELKLKVNEIKDLDVNKKELYVSLNKPIKNDEVDELKQLLINLSKLNISGVLFESVAIYNINKELNLGLNLIWSTMHIPTNYMTCNYWSDLGVNGALLSTELMIRDFVNIKKNTNMNIFVNLYGHIPMCESSRTLITNYRIYSGNSKDDSIHYLYDKVTNTISYAYEEYDNTFILGDILNGINDMKIIMNSKIDYVVLNSLLINEFDFNKIVEEYLNSCNGKYIKKDNIYEGFLHKESIFKVGE